MRNIARFALLIVFVGTGCSICIAQLAPTPAVKQQQGEQVASTADAGVTPLTYPYSISTEPHFAVFVEFPKADSIRRIALGDSNYFLAEADKTDPHYAIIKQIEAPTPKAKLPVETNMLVYMASGRVVNIMLKAGKLADTAYSVEYLIPNAQPATPANDPPPVPAESVKRETARAEGPVSRSRLPRSISLVALTLCGCAKQPGVAKGPKAAGPSRPGYQAAGRDVPRVPVSREGYGPRETQRTAASARAGLP